MCEECPTLCQRSTREQRRNAHATQHAYHASTSGFTSFPLFRTSACCLLSCARWGRKNNIIFWMVPTLRYPKEHYCATLTSYEAARTWRHQSVLPAPELYVKLVIQMNEYPQQCQYVNHTYMIQMYCLWIPLHIMLMYNKVTACAHHNTWSIILDDTQEMLNTAVQLQISV